MEKKVKPTQLFFVKATRINARIAEFVMPGMYINMDGYRYEQLSKRPVGRAKKRTLLNTDSNTRLVIYA
jgi:hypothetical protein|tara:strand:- start:1731 stop:1937 length:207 start_codon:yes stop_codon:yes gene_type:complete